MHRKLTFTPANQSNSESDSEVLKCIGNLSNHIIASANSKRLGVLKASSPKIFTSNTLYIQAIRLTCNYQFRIPSRRFIQDLFDAMVWDELGLKVLDRYHGLCFDTPVAFEFCPDSQVAFEVEYDESPVITSTPKTQFLPMMVKKGF